MAEETIDLNDLNFKGLNYIFFNRKILTNKPTCRLTTGRTYSSYDKKKFLKDLHEINWQNLMSAEKMSDKWKIFKNKFIDICNIHAPIRKLKIT